MRCKKIEDFSYALADRIGSGYSSEVFRGRNDLTLQPVAIKVIHIHRLSDLHRSLLRNEVEVLRKLKHPNLLALLDVYSTANNCYIISELCEQGDLESLLRKKAISPAALLPIARDIARGLQALRSANVIHRDLKPANVLLSQGVAKIADFGFAALSAEGVTENFSIGTPIYMPPEALSDNYYAPNHDIWSFGVIVFEALTGRVPWKAQTLQQLLLQVARPFLLPPYLPQRLSALIKGCLLPSKSRISLQQIWILLDLPGKEEEPREEQSLERTLPRWRSCKDSLNKTSEGFKRGKEPERGLSGRLNYCKYIHKVIRLVEEAKLEVPSQFVLLLRDRLESLREQTRGGLDGRERLEVEEFEAECEGLRGVGLFDKDLLNLQCELMAARTLRTLVSQGKPEEYLPEEEGRAAVVLDYTISLIQLLRLEQEKGIDRACQQVDMKRMVEGRPVRVQYQHREHMRLKLQHLGLL